MISNIFHRLCKGSLGMLWAIVDFFSSYRVPVKESQFIAALEDRPRSSLDEAFDTILSILDAVNEANKPISYLQSLEGALGVVKMHSSDVQFCRKCWLQQGICISSVGALLHKYHHNLERASHLPRHRCLSPDGSDDEAHMPDQFIPILKEICSSMHTIIPVLQRCREATKLVYMLPLYWTLRRKVEEGRREAMRLLENLNALLTPKTIYETPLNDIHTSTVLNIMQHATPKRYRLIDCLRLIKYNVLTITEVVDFPHVPYSAVSYPWRGNGVPAGYDAAEFSVVGAENADPIGVEVLHDACVAALARDAAYLWIDRLCIMQTSKEDKNWQIREMYDIYRCCVVCIVIPGGLRRLIPLDEETTWIHRGWTLQEALAPPSIYVLFAWRLGQLNAYTGRMFWKTMIEEVVSDRSAMTPLALLLDACSAGYLEFKYREQPAKIEVKLFSTKKSRSTNTELLSPSVTALAVLMSDDMDPYTKQYAIWKSAFMRTSSRPVDMVFSIMGLFGVTLDTAAFHANDRIGATIALCQTVLHKGGRASWLGISFRIPPCPHISTLPTIPHTSVSGRALIRVEDSKYREVVDFIESEYPISRAMLLPEGTMDNDGYFSFAAKSVRLTRIGLGNSDVPRLKFGYDDMKRPTYLKAVDGSVWKICEGISSPEEGLEAFAVLLGLFWGYFPGATPANETIRVLLVEEHAPRKFHLRSYIVLDSFARPWVRTEWTERQFCVGGPQTWIGGKESEERDEQIQENLILRNKLDLPAVVDNTLYTKFEAMEKKKAEDAVPQRILEMRLLV